MQSAANITPEQEIKQCIPQNPGADPTTIASWLAANEHDVNNGTLFLTDPLLAGDYNLLHLADPSLSYSASSRTAGMCGSTTEQFVREREDGETFIFPKIECTCIGSSRSKSSHNIYIQRPVCSKKKIHRCICQSIRASVRRHQEGGTKQLRL